MQNATPLISVIIPVYNHEQFLPATIDSVLSQTFKDYEVVITDDGSTDRSGRIADEYAARNAHIRVLHQPNQGLSGARNAAIAASRGQWLALLDSDDLWLPDALQHYAAAISLYPQARFLYGYYHRLNPDGSMSYPRGPHQDAPSTIVDLFQRMFLNPSCVCFRRDLFDQHGPFDPVLRHKQDYDLFLKFGRHIKFFPVGHAVTIRRRHADNMSKPTGFGRMYETRVMERFIEHHGGRNFIPEPIIRRRLARQHYTAGRLYFRQRFFDHAIEVLRISLDLHPTVKARGLYVLAQALRPMGREDPRPIPLIEAGK